MTYHLLGLRSHGTRLPPCRQGLAELMSRVLQRLLPTDLSVRVSPDWDKPTLSDEQWEYAVHDVYAAWLLYNAFAAQVACPDSGPVTGSTPSDMRVKLVSRNHCSTVAYGVLAANRPPKYNGVNVTRCAHSSTSHKFSHLHILYVASCSSQK